MPAPVEALPVRPARLTLPLDAATNRCAVHPVVSPGDPVACGQPVARGEALTVHAPLSGRVCEATAERLVIEVMAAGAANFAPVGAPSGPDELAAFAAEMGLAGMGGSMFPGAVKLRAATAIHTLVVNAVECEPGIEIDEALVRHQGEPVAAGIGLLRRALGIGQTVLAVKRGSALAGLRTIADEPVRVLVMPNRYPAGAEKLIVGRLAGRLPPAGVLPVQLGYLVFSAASLWALGRRAVEGRPSLDRPLTLVRPDGSRRNLLVPLGMSIGDLLAAAGVTGDPARHLLVAGGLMMGRQVSTDSAVLKGTNAVFVRTPERRLGKPEEPCILCGSCFDACPLGLHPIGMAERLRAGVATAALRAQLDECFLCGACSAVCPSEIPLIHSFREGKAWLRTR
jgi:electron transport complex protein RnfC